MSRYWAWAAMTWASLFAAISFYWAAGGTLGTSTLGGVADDVPAWVVWATGALKAVAAVAVALMAVRRFSRLGRLGVWGTGVICTLYGAANLAVRALMALGIIATPATMHGSAARWHLLLWDPWWLVGGLIFLMAGWGDVDTRRRAGRVER